MGQSNTSVQNVRSKFERGVQSAVATETYLQGIEPAVIRHIRDAVTAQPDSNVGWMEASDLVPGGVYHCSCEVWLPPGFRGVSLHFDNFGLAVTGGQSADLTKIEQWQRVSVYGVAKNSVLNFVLRCDAEAGAIFYSRGWRVGLGSALQPGDQAYSFPSLTP
jgi:hypothetical protein